MGLAPLCRVRCGDEVLEELDRCLETPSTDRDVLKEWTQKKPRRSGPTKPRERSTLRWGGRRGAGSRSGWETGLRVLC